MSPPAFDSCLTFCTPDENWPGKHAIQWQFPRFTITCTATSLDFAQAILDFMAETRNNPKYRDTPLGNGVHRYMDTKALDLSEHFQDLQLTLEKLGESDHSYFLRYKCANQLSLVVELRTPELVDSFVDGIRDIVDDYVDDMVV